MRNLLILSAVLFLCGCRGGPGDYVVSGSAYVESDRPGEKAVAKVEVQYRPSTETHDARDSALMSMSPKGASLGAPEPHDR
jgi:hypothetical protein